MKIQILWFWACISLVASKVISAKISAPPDWTKVLTTLGDSCKIEFRPNAPDLDLQKSVLTGGGTTTLAQIYLGATDKCALQKDGKATKDQQAAKFNWKDCSERDVFEDDVCADPRISTFQYERDTLVASSGTLTTTSGSIDCYKQGLVVQPTLAPFICPPGSSGPTGPTGSTGWTGATGPAGRPGKAGSPGSSGQSGYKGQPHPRPSQTRRRVRIVITNGTSTVTVGKPLTCDDREYTLPISDLRTGADFYIQKYRSRAVGACGTVETVAAYTVQHIQSGQYLVADVLDNTNLNVENSSSGVNLEKELNFPFGYAKFADNRLFASYETNIGEGIILCPLFHRTNCLLPTNKGYLRLASLYGSGSPTAISSFYNPQPDEISLFLRDSATRNGLVGRWYFKFVDVPRSTVPKWGH